MDHPSRIARPERLVGLNSVVEFTEAGRGFVMSREQDGEVRVRAARGLDRSMLKTDGIRPSRALTERVLGAGGAVISTHTGEDERFTASDSIRQMEVRSLLGMPVRGCTDVLGAFFLERTRGGADPCDTADLTLLQDFCDVVASALEMRRPIGALKAKSAELTVAKQALEDLNAPLREDVAAKSVEIARAERDLEDRTRAPHDVRRLRHRRALAADARRLRCARPRHGLSSASTRADSGRERDGQRAHRAGPAPRGPKADPPFLAINCAAIPENLLESELFGFKKGACTGETADEEGLSRAARSGTVFHDDVDEMPMSLPAKLLRGLQAREVRPMGGREPEKVDARIRAATNRDLRKDVAASRFRKDLSYRLAIGDVVPPRLRDRMEEVPALAEFFVNRTISEFGLPSRRLSNDAVRSPRSPRVVERVEHRGDQDPQ